MTTGQALQRTDGNPANQMVVATKSFLDKKVSAIAKWVRGGVQPEALVRFALQDMQTNPKLRESTPESIYLALLACAVTGLEPGALKQEAFLVPYARKVGDVWVQEAKFMAGWRGYQKQALRAGVKQMVSNVVYENDEFDMDLGTGIYVIHKPARGPRGALVGAYAWATLPNGAKQPEWLPLEDIEKIRQAAEKSKPSPAWRDWYDEMARKSAVRRLAKHLPMGDDYYNGLRIERASEGHDENGASDAEIIDLITDGDGTAGNERQLTDVATFGPAPDKAEAPAPAAKKVTTAAAAKPAANKPPIDAASTVRPTSAAGPASSPTSSASTSTTAAGNAPTKATGSSSATPPATANPTAGAAGSTLPAAFLVITAASSAPSSTTAPSASTASASTTPSTSSPSSPSTASSDDSAAQAEADAGESGDTSFEMSFGNEDPVDTVAPGPDATPVGVPTAEQVTAFNTWVKTAPADHAKAAKAAWAERFKAWVKSCTTKKAMDTGKAQWIAWAVANFKAPLPARDGKPAIPGDPESAEMQKAFAEHYKSVPAS